MPDIRNKNLNSRRAGQVLNGLGQYENYGYEYPTEQPAPTNPDTLKTFLDFGARLLAPQQPQQQPYYPTRQTAPSPAPSANFTGPLLLAAGLAVVFILTMPRKR